MVSPARCHAASVATKSPGTTWCQRINMMRSTPCSRSVAPDGKSVLKLSERLSKYHSPARLQLGEVRCRNRFPHTKRKRDTQLAVVSLSHHRKLPGFMASSHHPLASENRLP